jgi:hypothetical protein
VFLGVYSAASLSAVNLVTRNATGQSGALIQSDFDEYIIEVVNLMVGSNNALAAFQFSTDGGSTYITAGGYYWSNTFVALGTTTTGANGVAGGAPGSSIPLFSESSSNGINSANPLYGQYRIYAPASAKPFVCGSGISSDGANSNFYKFELGGTYVTAAITPNALRINLSTGTFSSGSVRVYGIVKS